MAAGTSKPVLYYTFENGTGTTVTDRSDAGNSLDGGFTATPGWDNTNVKRGSYSMNFCDAGKCAIGTGVVGSDSIGDLTTFNFIHQTCVWTISMWVRQTTAAYHAFCGNVAGAGSGMCILYSSSKIRALGHGVNHTFASTGLTADTWTHVLLTCDGPGAGNLKCYMDGVQTGGDQSGGVIQAGNQTNTWVVGNTGYSTGLWSTSFSGQMDEYSIWDVAFTAADVATIYGGGSPPDVTCGLVACGPPTTEVKTISGITADSIKTIAGISVANIKKIGDVTPPPSWTPAPPVPWAETYSMDFDGGAIASADQLALSTNSDFDFEYTDPFSLSAWFKTTTTAWQGMVEKTVTYSSFANIKGWGIAWYAGRPQLWINNAYGTNGLQAYPTSGLWSDGAWHNVVATSAGTGGSLVLADIAIWVDGVSQALAGWSGVQSVSLTIITAADIRVGSVFGGYGSGWNGGLDEISVWDTELGPVHVSDIYNSGVPTNLSDHSSAANLVSWWRMGDGCTSPSAQGGCDGTTGTADSSDSSDSGARIYDMSTNSHNMTPVNTVAGDIVTDVP